MNAAKRYAIFARTLGAVLALAATAGAAHAQNAESDAKGRWSVKAGGFFPTQGILRGQAGQPYWVVGAEYDPNLRFKIRNGRITFGAEAMYRESGGARFLTIPLTAQVTWNITPQDSRLRVYGGLGGGVYFINTAFRGETIQPGAKFILGADINEHWFFETNFHYVGGFVDNFGNGVHNNGLSLLLGYRY